MLWCEEVDIDSFSKLNLFDSGLDVFHLSLQSGQLLVQNSQPANERERILRLLRCVTCAIGYRNKILTNVYCDTTFTSVSLISEKYTTIVWKSLSYICGVLIWKCPDRTVFRTDSLKVSWLRQLYYLDRADRSKALRNSAIFLTLEAIVSTNSLLFQSCWIWLCTDDIAHRYLHTHTTYTACVCMREK